MNISPEDWKGASSLQLSALQLVTFASQLINLGNIETVQAQTMVDRSRIVRAHIPSDQWITEVQAWEAFVWASSQVAITDYAIGPSIRYPGVIGNVIPPETIGDKELCRSMKMRKAGGFV
jgi:hypothetical protein